MSRHLMADLGIDSRIAGSGWEQTRPVPASIRLERTSSGRAPGNVAVGLDERSWGVEAVEPRISLSGFTVRPMYEDPNQRSPKLVRPFNPQPAPPTVAIQIIAI